MSKSPYRSSHLFRLRILEDRSSYPNTIFIDLVQKSWARWKDLIFEPCFWKHISCTKSIIGECCGTTGTSVKRASYTDIQVINLFRIYPGYIKKWRKIEQPTQSNSISNKRIKARKGLLNENMLYWISLTEINEVLHLDES